MAQVPKSWTLLISKQLSYFENVPMGFDKKAIVSVPFPADSLGISKIDYLRNRLLAVKGIEQVSFTAAPLAWYFIHQRVQNYVYRIPISGWIFILGGIGALLVALVTVSFQAIKAERSNPATRLRSE